MGNSMEEAFKKAGYKKTENQKTTAESARFHLEKDYTQQAERIIKSLKESMGPKFKQFTTSKIRNILAMVNDVYNDVNLNKNEFLSPEIQRRIAYIKVRLVYECGREPEIIRPFVKQAGLLDLLDSIGDNHRRFIDFANYMEALVAYHLFYGGKDN